MCAFEESHQRWFFLKIFLFKSYVTFNLKWILFCFFLQVSGNSNAISESGALMERTLEQVNIS